jgi:hypothetical protein
MSIKGKRVIWVGPADGSNAKPSTIEGIATTAVITPGSVVIQAASDAGFELSDVAATLTGNPFVVADKDQMRTKSVDDAWAIDENMVAIQTRSGEYLNVLVITAQALVIGTPLSRSGTDGALKIAVTPAIFGATSEEILCYVDEIVTTTATQLVRVRVA